MDAWMGDDVSVSYPNPLIMMMTLIASAFIIICGSNYNTTAIMRIYNKGITKFFVFRWPAKNVSTQVSE